MLQAAQWTLKGSDRGEVSPLGDVRCDGPSYLGSERDQGLDEDRRLGVDVGAADNLGPLERLVLLGITKGTGLPNARRGTVTLGLTYPGLLPEGHDARHLLLGDLNLPPAIGVLLDAADAKI